MLCRDRERLGEILGCARLRLGQGVIVEQVGSVSVNQSAATGGGAQMSGSASSEKKGGRRGAERDAQSEAVLPAPGKVFDVDFVVRSSLALTPQQQPFFGVRAFFAVVGAGIDRSESVPHSDGAKELSYLMSAMEKRRTRLQIMPRMSLRFPSTTSSGPMLVKWTPISLIRSSALTAFSIFCTR